MSRAYERRELEMGVRVRYLEDDADRSDQRHADADAKFDKVIASIDEQVDALRQGQVVNQRVLISILASLIVAALMLAANLAVLSN